MAGPPGALSARPSPTLADCRPRWCGPTIAAALASLPEAQIDSWTKKSPLVSGRMWILKDQKIITQKAILSSTFLRTDEFEHRMTENDPEPGRLIPIFSI
jgi:hypothetical protein